MKLRYIGKSFYVEGLTNGEVYECLGIEGAYFRVIDDSGEDYVYRIINPGPPTNSNWPARWDIVEDSDDRLLERTIDEWAEKTKRMTGPPIIEDIKD